MSASSDSDEFYDAEDLTPNRSSRKKTIKDAEVSLRTDSESNISLKEIELEERTEKSILEEQFFDQLSSTSSASQETLKDDSEQKPEPHLGRRRFRELRQRMQTEDDDTMINNASPPDSQTSSVEGVFAAPTKTSHPFRIIEHDALSLQSMTSLGRVGRILSGSIDPTVGVMLRDSHLTSSALTVASAGKEDDSSSETFSIPSQNIRKSPSGSSSVLTRQTSDVIASTKTSTTVGSNGKSFDVTLDGGGVTAPIAPPRRKKKSRVQTPRTLTPPTVEEVVYATQQSPLPSPASTIESLTREFENSLDISSAIKGQYVVKPQVRTHDMIWTQQQLPNSSMSNLEKRSLKLQVHLVKERPAAVKGEVPHTLEPPTKPASEPDSYHLHGN
uniref:Uncharacterized protein n=1 Tax=Timema poppense TaxID=170557 RepID=A0A7R9H379_TIMPO|nr:unnamed protein product [Timema poppensis]